MSVSVKYKPANNLTVRHMKLLYTVGVSEECLKINVHNVTMVSSRTSGNVVYHGSYLKFLTYVLFLYSSIIQLILISVYFIFCINSWLRSAHTLLQCCRILKQDVSTDNSMS
jgi:hypothetical protein